MTRKPGSMYRYVRGQLTTRKEYMGGIPSSRITQFVQGNKVEKFPLKLSLVANEHCLIRHTSLESARIAGNRAMEKNVGTSNYRMKVRVYPHVVLRENKQATGAGADRVSQGMRAAYGKIVSIAAHVERNQPIMDIETAPQFLKESKEALRKAGMKLPSPCHVIIS